MDAPLRKPWFVAAWPGMGGVAQIAARHLVNQLGARVIEEIDVREFFDLPPMSVKDGVATAAEPARHLLFAWHDPSDRRDLLILLGDQQPTHGARRYADLLLRAAQRHGAERVFTFAAMAASILPSAPSRVFVAATSSDLLSDAKLEGMARLADGEISGLNGAFIAAAAQRGLPGFCLLGEFPFFAASVPNPKASAAVLRAFATLADVTIDLGHLDAEGARIERGLNRHLEDLKRAAEKAERGGRDIAEATEFEPEPEADLSDGAPAPADSPAKVQAALPIEPELAPEARQRIEDLFDASRSDRAKAMELKAELDRHGVFRRYEDRFLDLFRKAG